jgi:hypothetical protein
VAVKQCVVLGYFDVQGTFNGIHPEILRERMQDGQILVHLVGWVYSFCLALSKRVSEIDITDKAGRATYD